MQDTIARIIITMIGIKQETCSPNDAPAPNEKVTTPKKGFNKKLLIPIIGVVALVAIIAVVCLVILSVAVI